MGRGDHRHPEETQTLGAIGVEPCVRVGGAEGRERAGRKGSVRRLARPACPLRIPGPRQQPPSSLCPPVPAPAARGAPGRPPSWWGKLAALHGSLQTHAKPPVPSANQLIAFQVEDPKVIWDQDEPRQPDKAGP